MAQTQIIMSSLDAVPTFSGNANENVLEFFKKVEQYAIACNWTENQKLAIAKVKLNGLASEFLDTVLDLNVKHTWDEFKNIVIRKFEKKINVSEVRFNFCKCVQYGNENISSYVTRLRVAAKNLISFSDNLVERTIESKFLERELIEQFKNGINKNIRRIVLSRVSGLANPTFDEVVEIAQQEEHNEQMSTWVNGNYNQRYSNYGQKSECYSEPHKFGSVREQINFANAFSRRPGKYGGRTNYNQYRHFGPSWVVCFACGKYGHVARNCRVRWQNRRVPRQNTPPIPSKYVIPVLDNCDAYDDEAIVVDADVNDSRVVFIIDTGAKVSLIKKSVVKGHRIIPANNINVTGISGNRIKIYGKILIDVLVNGAKFKVEFYVCDDRLGINSDGLLGRQTLKEMGAIIDITKNTVKFMEREEEVLYFGNTSNQIEKEIDRMLCEVAQLKKQLDNNLARSVEAIKSQDKVMVNLVTVRPKKKCRKRRRVAQTIVEKMKDQNPKERIHRPTRVRKTDQDRNYERYTDGRGKYPSYQDRTLDVSSGRYDQWHAFFGDEPKRCHKGKY